MKLKKLLKKKEYNKYTTIEIIDIPKHWSITTNIHDSFYVKPLEPYFKNLLKRKVEQVWISSETRITVKIY